MKQGAYYGMQTFHQALVDLIQQEGNFPRDGAGSLLQSGRNHDGDPRRADRLRKQRDFLPADLNVVFFTTEPAKANARAPGALAKILKQLKNFPSPPPAPSKSMGPLTVVPKLRGPKNLSGMSTAFSRGRRTSPSPFLRRIAFLVFLSADRGRVVGLLHAGWRGVRGGFWPEAVRLIRRQWRV